MGRKDGHRLAENFVPEGWKQVRLGDVASIRREKEKPSDDDRRPYVGLEHIASGGILNGYAEARSAISDKTSFRKGDTLFGKLRPNLRKVVRIKFDGGCSTDILALFPRSLVDGSLLSHILRSDQLHSHAMRGIAGTKMPRTSWPHLQTFRFGIPPLHEQRAIAAVLDSIDEAIERTEAVIAATEQLRDSLLHELLTRGVPGWHTEWKDVPGLGSIPADWDVVRLGDVAEVRSGQSDPRKPIFQNSMFIAPDDIESATGKLLRKRTVADARAISGKYEFDERDVVYSKIRPYLMKVYLPKGAGLCSADMYPLRTKSGLLRHYLAFALLSREFTAYARTCSDRTGIPKINRDDLLKYRLPLPRREEQHSIADTIEGADEAITQADEARKRLQELKASAADALLTGRVRTLEDRAVENG